MQCSATHAVSCVPCVASAYIQRCIDVSVLPSFPSHIRGSFFGFFKRPKCSINIHTCVLACGSRWPNPNSCFPLSQPRTNPRPRVCCVISACAQRGQLDMYVDLMLIISSVSRLWYYWHLYFLGSTSLFPFLILGVTHADRQHPPLTARFLFFIFYFLFLRNALYISVFDFETLEHIHLSIQLSTCSSSSYIIHHAFHSTLNKENKK